MKNKLQTPNLNMFVLLDWKPFTVGTLFLERIVDSLSLAPVCYRTEANSMGYFLWLETLYQCIETNPVEVDWEYKVENLDA